MPLQNQRQKKKPKIAIVLGGGAVKAASFHVGALMALEKHGIKAVPGKAAAPLEHDNNAVPYPVSTVVGSSAGAIISAVALSGIQIERLPKIFTQKNPVIPPISYSQIFQLRKWRKPAVLGNRSSSWLKSAEQAVQALIARVFNIQGLFSTRGIAEYTKKHFLSTDCFQDLMTELFIVGTDVRENRGLIFGPKNYFRNMPRTSFLLDVPISEAVACSSALPVIYEPYHLKSKTGDLAIMDGEVFFTCPFEIALAAKADIVIISQIYRPYEIKSSDKTNPLKVDEIGLMSFYSLIYNNFCRRLAAHRAETPNSIVVVEPRNSDYPFFKLPHFSLSKQHLNLGIETGFHAANDAISKIKNAIRGWHNNR